LSRFKKYSPIIIAKKSCIIMTALTNKQYAPFLSFGIT
jgi:hypothetical protein